MFADSLGEFDNSHYSGSVTTEPRVEGDLNSCASWIRYTSVDGGSVELPALLQRLLLPADRLAFLSTGNTEILTEGIRSERHRQQFLHVTVGYVGQPRGNPSGGFWVRADLPKSGFGLKSLFITGGAMRRYFYGLSGEGQGTLYDILRSPERASVADMRMSWRVRNVELGLDPARAAERIRVEKSFNVLAHPDLRNCYDSLRRDEDAPPLFPYGGFGSILVEGHLSSNGEAFFADRILAYRPEMVQRKVSLLLRQCEFAADRMICRDPRRRIEVWIDRGLLPGVAWDATWNRWRHWLRSRIDVEATFVSSGRYLFRNGEWVLRRWLVALPSRTRVAEPAGIGADIERALAIHSLLGEHAAVVERARELVEKEPIEYSTIQRWFDELNVSPHLKPQHVNWRADYEPYYFEQLRRRCQTWFLFRDEFLFVLPQALASEVPQPGRATYLFARPVDITRFVALYATVRREDIRRNRDDIASKLGFIGRVVRGHRRRRWLSDVLRSAGEIADCVEAFD